MRNAPRKQLKWWAVLVLPMLLRALIPVGFMPIAGPNHSLELVVCDGDGPLSAPASMSMSMKMPAGMAMKMPVGMAMDMPPGTSMEGIGSTPGSPHPSHGHAIPGTCPYGSAPALGALPTLAILPSLPIQLSLKASLATAQVAYIEASLRSQSARAPPAQGSAST